MKYYENFCCTYRNLSDAITIEPPYTVVIRAGLVGLFKLAFEQSWKMMKALLEDCGYKESATGSPRMILKTAYQAGMIDDSAVWLKALSARNNVSHSYNEDIALGIIRETKEYYLKMFADLKAKIEQDWLPVF